MERLPHPDDAGPAAGREHDPLRQAVHGLPDFEEDRLLPFHAIGFAERRDVERFGGRREVRRDPTGGRDVAVNADEMGPVQEGFAGRFLRAAFRQQDDGANTVDGGVQGQGRPRVSGGRRHEMRGAKGAGHRDGDGHAAGLERPRRIASFVFHVQPFDLDRRDSPSGPEDLESMERRPALPSGADL